MENLTERTSENVDEIIKVRKEKIFNFFKSSQIWVAALLIVAVVLGVYIRSLPMADHGGNPGLWDITTNSWTLGPDLDPWLFTRMAKTIAEEGALPEIDNMRYVPIGFNTNEETVLLPYLIFWSYKLSKIFYPSANVEFGAVLFPVIMFGLTIIAFFFFVREVFSEKNGQNKTRANIIALISTFLMIVMPVILPRTVAGIPEKESAMFFFLFSALFLFLKAWKSTKIKTAVIFGILAGIFTAFLTLVSGLSTYFYWTIFLSGLIAFILNKFEKKEIIIYIVWWLSNRILLSTIPGKGSVGSFISASLLNSATFFLLILLLVHLLLWKTKISENKFLKKINLPKTIVSLLILIFIILVVSLLVDPSIISDKFKQINRMLFKPTVGRWNMTVAENKQPYFTEWVASIGPYLKSIPIIFWMFFIGSIVLFKNMIKELEKKQVLTLTGLYIFFLMGLMFSRYSSSSLFNGENFISKAFFVLSATLLAGFFIYYFIKSKKNENTSFEKIEYSYIVLMILLILSLFASKSAIRLIMLLGPISVIFAAYLIDQSVFSFKNSKEEKKIFLGIIMIVLMILIIFAFSSYYKTIKSQAYSSVPSPYNQQWQKAMQWVRDNTAQDAVFAHWWDYGYWVQSIGNRATVTDGGNAVSFWNYYTGRLVLTGDNQNDALEFLYNHDADYLLIDSSDIGKYGAFSSIGSDENYDRLSFIPAIALDKSRSKETSDGVNNVYTGGIGLDEDVVYELGGEKIFLPSGQAGIGGITIESSKKESETLFSQPIAIFVYNGQQYNIPLRYLEYNSQFVDFGSGLEGTAKIIPSISISGEGTQIENMGAVMYISPRVMRGYFGQKYLLNDPFNKFPNLKLVHSEDNLVVEIIRDQGISINEFVYYQGIQGPIKIWKIEYTGQEKERPEYLDTDPSKYLSWEL